MSDPRDASSRAGTNPRRGAPPMNRPHDYYSKLMHLRAVRGSCLPDLDVLLKKLAADLGRTRPLSARQLNDQLRGNVNHNPRLPKLLDSLVPLGEFDMSWSPSVTQAEFEQRLPPVGLGENPVEELRSDLEAWAKEAPAKSFSILKARRAGESQLQRLEPGRHIIAYQMAGAAEKGHILLLELDERQQEWLCLSAMKGFLPENKPCPATGQFEIPISSAPGICTIFFIAGPKSFGHKIESITGRIRQRIEEGKQQDGAMDKIMTAQLLRQLNEERAAAKINGARCLGSFRYQVF